jgi:hypothetical protein
VLVERAQVRGARPATARPPRSARAWTHPSPREGAGSKGFVDQKRRFITARSTSSISASPPRLSSNARTAAAQQSSGGVLLNSNLRPNVTAIGRLTTASTSKSIAT